MQQKPAFLATLVLTLFSISFGLSQQLTIWTHFGEADLHWLEGEVAAFEAAFEVDVEIVILGLEEIGHGMIAGEAADLVVSLPHEWLEGIVGAGVAADMARFTTASYLEDFSEGARLAFTSQGSLYGLPLYLEGPALIVNRELISEPPETFEAFIASAQELTAGQSFGFLYDIGNFYFSYVWMRSLGGYVFGRDEALNHDPDDVGLAGEGAVAGAELMKHFSYDWNLIPPETDYETAHQSFIEGSLAMIYNGPWAVPDYRDAGLELAAMPIPPPADGPEFSGFMGVHGILVSAFSPQAVTAANLAKWLTRPEAQVFLAETSGRIPSSRLAAQRLADDPVIAGFAAALSAAEPIPAIAEMGGVWVVMAGALKAILADEASDPAAILEEAAREISATEP